MAKNRNKENRVPPTNQVPPLARDVELERLRALNRELCAKVARRTAQLAILRLEVAETKKRALQRKDEWRRRQGGEGA
jgi:hypothetical protein